MMRSNFLRFQKVFFLMVFLVLLSIQFVQFGSYALDGDISSICLPIETCQPVFDDPFGFKLWEPNPQLYSGTNRFFCTYLGSHYLNEVPLLLQHVTSPINSLFLAIQLFKMATLLFGVYLVYLYARLFLSSHAINTPLTMCFITILFQNEGFYEQMSIIDHSIVYTFYYGFSILLIFLLFYPFVKSYIRHRSLDINFFEWLYVLPLMVIVPFFGSINAPFVLFTLFFCAGFFLLKWLERPVFSFGTVALLLFLFLVSLYSQYISYFNLENPTSIPSLPERYLLLAKGIFHLFTMKAGWLILVGVTGFNLYWLHLKNSVSFHKGILFLFLFSLSYLFLLPLGGYRTYRPNILRYDNFIPISLLMFILFVVISTKVYQKLPIASLYKRAAMLLIGLIFFFANFKFCDERALTESQFNIIQNSPDFNVKINNNVKILNWEIVETPEKSYYASLMLRRWKIVDKDFRFYQK